MYKIYCDGASRSNPGEASIGVSITKETKEIEFIAQKIGIATNTATSLLLDGGGDLLGVVQRRDRRRVLENVALTS